MSVIHTPAHVSDWIELAESLDDVQAEVAYADLRVRSAVRPEIKTQKR
jgi:hypothetical protein